VCVHSSVLNQSGVVYRTYVGLAGFSFSFLGSYLGLRVMRFTDFDIYNIAAVALCLRCFGLDVTESEVTQSETVAQRM
jgi:hypothetical protein